MTEESYQLLKKIFYETPEWIQKKQIREMSSLRRIHYKVFIKVMKLRVNYSLRRMEKFTRNFQIQERAYVLLGSKLLFHKKFVESIQVSERK